MQESEQFLDHRFALRWDQLFSHQPDEADIGDCHRQMVDPEERIRRVHGFDQEFLALQGDIESYQSTLCTLPG